jgi:hypothetical protein
MDVVLYKVSAVKAKNLKSKNRDSTLSLLKICLIFYM